MAQKIHKHTNSLISGCFYITKPDNAPLKILCDPHMFKGFDFEFPYERETAYNKGMIEVDATQGDVAIFPGHLFHYVENTNNEGREVIGFSAFVFGDFSKSLNNWARYNEKDNLPNGYGSGLILK